MITSSSSESEFWNDLNENKATKSVGVLAMLEEKQSVNNEINQEVLLSACSNSYFHDRLQELLGNLRVGSEMIKEQELEKETRRLTRLFEKQTQELIKKQQLELLDMKKDYDSLKSLLVEKDLEISRLQQLLVDQELPLTKQRLFKKITRANLIKDQKEKEENKEKDLQILALDSQIDMLKELIITFQSQTEKAKHDLRVCEDELSYTREKASEDIIELQNQSNQKESELNQKIQEISEKYQTFKEEVRKEIEINSLVIKQQIDLNNILKRELKTAKMVLITPRLREKFNNKLPVDNHQNLNRIKKHLHKKDSTNEYLTSTRASPANYSITDMSFQSSSPLVGLLPEISSRYISQ